MTSTKQFVSLGGNKLEERNAASSLIAQFFFQGQIQSSTPYFYARSHFNSITELTNTSGLIQAQYAYDAFGRIAKIQGATSLDFQFAGMYNHSRSTLNLAMFREYNAQTGRWLSREPLGEAGSLNLFTYCYNDPIRLFDSFGDRPVNFDFSGKDSQTNSPEGVTAIGAEGDVGSIQNMTNKPQNMSPDGINSMMGGDKKKKPCLIHLVACHGAEGPGGDRSSSYAAKLAKATGCYVVASMGFCDCKSNWNHSQPWGGETMPNVMFSPDGSMTGYSSPMTSSNWSNAMSIAGMQ